MRGMATKDDLSLLRLSYCFCNKTIDMCPAVIVEAEEFHNWVKKSRIHLADVEWNKTQYSETAAA